MYNRQNLQSRNSHKGTEAKVRKEKHIKTLGSENFGPTALSVIV